MLEGWDVEGIRSVEGLDINELSPSTLTSDAFDYPLRSHILRT
jgi:hypothetical protein